MMRAMGLHEEFGDRLKEAMKAKDERVLNVVRMIRSRAKKTAVETNRDLDDDLYQETIQSYVKQMKRAITEYEEAGDSGLELAAGLRFEVEYLEPFLPKLMGEDDVRSIVKAVIAEHGITGAKLAGRVVGLVMKDHKGQVEPAMVKRVAEEELS
jgi:uncharacterized protein YqeY